MIVAATRYRQSAHKPLGAAGNRAAHHVTFDRALGIRMPAPQGVRFRARVTTEAGPERPRAVLVANCRSADVPSACKIAASDLAGAEVCAGLELPSGTDGATPVARDEWTTGLDDHPDVIE